ncbi:MAG: helicase, partial [Gammaproteobacteria bacterium]|nr:helicase [Gammaproteobacteria bacterium]
MYKQHGQFHFSPSDLTRYMESPFASWMDRFIVERPEQAPEQDPADALMSSLAQKGYAHEDALETTFAEQGLVVVKIEGESADEKQDSTLEAMHQGADVIVQARLELVPFGGYADFLVKVQHAEGAEPSLLGNWHYEVWDTKLANKLKPTFVIQLCCYAQILESIQGRLPEFITVALGNGDHERLRTKDYFYYYQTLKSSFVTDQ